MTNERGLVPTGHDSRFFECFTNVKSLWDNNSSLH